MATINLKARNMCSTATISLMPIATSGATLVYADNKPYFTYGTRNETNCPNCGAPVDRFKWECPYCKTPY